MANHSSADASAARTYGPLFDLERHLPSDWWRNLFNAVYLRTDGDVVENAQNTRHEVDLFIKSTGAEPADRILDLCCGQGRHVLELAARGYRHVTGIDRSRYLVRLARRRARQADLIAAFREETPAWCECRKARSIMPASWATPSANSRRKRTTISFLPRSSGRCARAACSPWILPTASGYAPTSNAGRGNGSIRTRSSAARDRLRGTSNG